MTSIYSRFVTTVAILFVAQPALAQYGVGSLSLQGGTVSGAGIVNIKRQPEIMRLHIALLAKGSNLQEALAALKERSEAARLQLGVLGASKNSISIDPPSVSSAQGNQQRQMMERMIAQQLRRRGRRPGKKPKKSNPVTVSAQLTAEWNLTGKTAEQLLLTSHELQEKIKSADLAGSKEVDKLSPEEQELLDEAQETYGYGGNDQPKPGVPAFLFVSKISAKDREEALATAFEKAKSKAARLAKAAGVNLGELRSLSSHNSSARDYDEYDMFGGSAYSSPNYQMLQRAMISENQGGESSEALGASAAQVAYSITVNAAFDLKKK